MTTETAEGERLMVKKQERREAEASIQADR